MLTIPERLAATCRGNPEATAWLERLPQIVRRVQDEWAILVADPIPHREGTCSLVAPATRRDGMATVLKITLPHLEAKQESAGLRFWNGDPTVRLLEASEELDAMLLERCEPGTTLRDLAEPEQDAVIARLLRRLWRRPSPPHPFRPLADMIAH